MAQKEMMLRILKGGKNNAYYWFTSIKAFEKSKEKLHPDCRKKLESIAAVCRPKPKFIKLFWKRPGGMWRIGGELPIGDSFELGIKVGDEWWFEGDKGYFPSAHNITEVGGELCVYYEENAHYAECGDMVLAMCSRRNEKPCIMSDGGLCYWYTTEDELNWCDT